MKILNAAGIASTLSMTNTLASYRVRVTGRCDNWIFNGRTGERGMKNFKVTANPGRSMTDQEFLELAAAMIARKEKIRCRRLRLEKLLKSQKKK